MDKKEYKRRMEVLGDQSLQRLQRELKSCNIPVMIVFEGFGGAGKGTQINHLIEPIFPGLHCVFYSGRDAGGAVSSIPVEILE